MMDISDGLLLDASRLARLNGVDLALERALIPMSPHVRSHRLGERAALSGGEDYILLFTAPPDESPPADTNARRIGTCRAMQSLEEEESATRRALERAPSVLLDDKLCEDVGHAALGHLYQLNSSS